MKHFKAFTLAEIMITLTVIGIISAIIMPIAIKSVPDENIMKFKKANSTLYQVIQELVNSDEYYNNGYLGEKKDGTKIAGGLSAEEAIDDETKKLNRKYFCESFANIVSAKLVNCSTLSSSKTNGYILSSNLIYSSGVPEEYYTVDSSTIASTKAEIDNQCKIAQSVMGAEIITQDGVVFYQTKPGITFGTRLNSSNGGGQIFAKPGTTPTFKDQNGFDIAYKMFCIDVDEINKGEDPFGYGIRADGKILTGKRADEWLEKSIQGE